MWWGVWAEVIHFPLQRKGRYFYGRRTLAERHCWSENERIAQNLRASYLLFFHTFVEIQEKLQRLRYCIAAWDINVQYIIIRHLFSLLLFCLFFSLMIFVKIVFWVVNFKAASHVWISINRVLAIVLWSYYSS
jgi:hypothetical protein